MTSHTELETPDPGPGAGQVLPVLPLRDVVVFPHMVIPLFVGREKSIPELDLAMEGDKRILLLAHKSEETDDPEDGRSEERRVGEESVSRGRSRWWVYP